VTAVVRRGGWSELATLGAAMKAEAGSWTSGSGSPGQRPPPTPHCCLTWLAGMRALTRPTDPSPRRAIDLAHPRFARLVRKLNRLNAGPAAGRDVSGDRSWGQV
jgi:hypothetical protein